MRRPSLSTALRLATALVCAGAALSCHADPEAGPPRGLAPDGWFAQFGVAKEVTMATGGALWTLKDESADGPWSAYAEASLSRWQARNGHAEGHGVLTQLALIPVLRHRFDAGRSPWFVEGGIGATVTSSIYRSDDKRFSTAFNFGDHVGVGYSFGNHREQELALRVQHFSNAGIKHPNPGENFLQLRYAHRF